MPNRLFERSGESKDCEQSLISQLLSRTVFLIMFICRGLILQGLSASV
jgi:hypothetical protein